MAISSAEDDDTDSWVVLDNIETSASLSWKDVVLLGPQTFSTSAHLGSKNTSTNSIRTRTLSKHHAPVFTSKSTSKSKDSDTCIEVTPKASKRSRNRFGARGVASHEDVKGMRGAKFDDRSRYSHLRGHTGRFNHISSYNCSFEEKLDRVSLPHNSCGKHATCTHDPMVLSEKSSCNGLYVPVTEFDVKHGDIGNGSALPSKGRWNELEEDLERMAERVEVEPWEKWKQPSRHYYVKILGHAKFEKAIDIVSPELDPSNGYSVMDNSIFPKPGYIYGAIMGPPRRHPLQLPTSLTKATVLEALHDIGVTLKVAHKPVTNEEEVFNRLVGEQKIYVNNEFVRRCKAWTSHHTSWVEMIRPSDIVKGHSTTYMVIDLGRNTLVQEIRTLANYPKLREFPDKEFLDQHGINSYRGPVWLLEKDAQKNRHYEWVTAFVVEYRAKSGSWIPLRRISCARDIAKETRHTLNTGAGVYCRYLRIRPVASFGKGRTARVGIRLGLYGKQSLSCAPKRRTRAQSDKDPTLKVYTVTPRDEKRTIIPDCQGLGSDWYVKYERGMLKARKRRQLRKTIVDGVQAMR